jgi:hypothetical protein
MEPHLPNGDFTEAAVLTNQEWEQHCAGSDNWEAIARPHRPFFSPLAM